MTEQQAKDLAARIRLQLPFHSIRVLESDDKRNKPYNWFIAIAPSEAYEGRELLIHSAFEWEQATIAWEVLKEG